MKMVRKLLRTGPVGLGIFVFLFVLLWLHGGEVLSNSDDATYPYLPMITEICPFPVDDVPPWIEFQNPLDETVRVAGLEVYVNDALVYAFPDSSIGLVGKRFILLYLDGQGDEANVHRAEERTWILHSAKDLSSAMKDRPGKLAVYQKGPEERKELVGFVSWGAPASSSGLTRKRQVVWPQGWFVEMGQSTGDFKPLTLKNADYSIGLYPGSRTASLADWVVYSRKESTPGRENLVPPPALFSPSNGAEMRSQDIQVGWVMNRHTKAYHFQMSKEPYFRTTLHDTTMEAPPFHPELPLPEGTYYYRVKSIAGNGRKSAWSIVRKVVSWEMVMGKGWGSCVPKRDVEEKLLNGVEHRYQRKDTSLLCIDGCESGLAGSTQRRWDEGHPPAVLPGDHGFKNCVRASVSMMVSFYDKTLSQDRIAHYTEEVGNPDADGRPDGDLSHMMGMTYKKACGGENTEALEWALNSAVEFYHKPPDDFGILKGWLDQDRPIMTRLDFAAHVSDAFPSMERGGPGHVLVMDGYRIDQAGNQWIHILDPYKTFRSARWETFSTWRLFARGLWVGPTDAPNARGHPPGETEKDGDGDGIMDFDEAVRFHTNLASDDTDGDGVKDKDDIREYVFDANGDFDKKEADFDQDGLRKEVDEDNDDDGLKDGEEDKNGNGRFEPNMGETNNFHKDQ